MLTLSTLHKTWILDIDGTILKHNGYLQGNDVLLEGVKNFFENLPKGDKVILLTARRQEELESLQLFLAKEGIIYHHILCDIPLGERILVNDKKPSGLKTAFAINKERDEPFKIAYQIDKKI